MVYSSTFWPDLIILILFASAIQYILGGAVITEFLRKPLPKKLSYLLRCPACCGFWVGIGLYFLGFTPWISISNEDLYQIHMLSWQDYVQKYLGALYNGLVTIVAVPFVRGFMVSLVDDNEKS